MNPTRRGQGPGWAPLAVAVELRVLDDGPEAPRWWRTSLAIAEEGVHTERDLPVEPGRPVSVRLRLPDEDGHVVTATGVVLSVPPDDPETEGEASRPRAIRFTDLSPTARTDIARYVEDRSLE